MPRFPWTLTAAALLVTGCTSMCGKSRASLTPEQVVEGYLDVALNMRDVSERELLLDFTTGNPKSAIESASPETIKAAYVDRQYKIENYSVVERLDRTPREVEITFELTYHDLGSGKSKPDEAPKVTTANSVSVVKESGAWMIRDVLGNKTSIDFPVSEESRISAKPGPGVDDEAPVEPGEPEPAPEGATQGG